MQYQLICMEPLLQTSTENPFRGDTTYQYPSRLLLRSSFPAVTDKPRSFPTATAKDAMDKWLKAHQSQFKGQAVAFKKHVSEVCNVPQNSAASEAEYVSASAKYGLNEKLAGRMSINNLSTFIAACQYEAA